MRISAFWSDFADRCPYLPSLLPQQERTRYLKTAERSLFNMILETRDCRCHDPRDRISALMSVIDHEESSQLKEKYHFPDYHLTYIEVVVKIIHHIESTGEVRLFRGSTSGFSVTLGVPEYEASLLAIDVQLCKDVTMFKHRRIYDWKALASKYRMHRGLNWGSSSGCVLVVGCAKSNGSCRISVVF